MVAECEEFKRFQEADKAQKEDEDAQVLLVAYNYKRSQLMQKAAKPDVTREEMLEIKKKYGDERKTQIVPEKGEVTIEDLTPNTPMAVYHKPSDADGRISRDA